MKKLLSALLGIFGLLFAVPSFANCNMFHLEPQTLYGVTLTMRDDGAYVLNGTCGTNGNFFIGSPSLGVGTYTLAVIDRESNPDMAGTQVQAYSQSDIGTNMIVKMDSGENYVTRTFDTDYNDVLFRIRIQEGITYDNYVIKPMFVKGATVPTEYTPYNPLCATCKNGVSPNLFETVDTTSGLYGVTLTSAANGLVTVVGTATGGGGRNTARLQNFTLPAGTYTVSFSGTKRSQLYLVAGNDSNAQNLITDVNGGTFTISESKTLHFGLNLNNGTTYNDSFYIQLEAGSTATPYQPYGCIAPIKIATTKYNESAFSPLNTALANAISVVDTVVSNTITQAGRIATLQAQKQTRPNDIADDNEKCPAGKKCLLVEDASGIPHWYEIVENAWDLPVGYTQLEYIKSTGTQYIDTGLTTSAGTTEIKVVTDFTLLDINTDVASVVLYISSPNSGLQAYIYKGGSNIYNQGASAGQVRTDVDYIMETVTTANMRSIQLNGGQVISQTYDRSITDNSPIYTFGSPAASGTNSCMIAKIRNQKFYRNGILVRDFIPAKNASGVVGMYDTVEGRFYTDAGSGEFIAGDPVSE